jgi:hypothetical protein
MTIANIDVTQFQNTVFTWVIVITYLLYFSIAFGLSANAPDYLETLQYWVKIYISLFLIIRFNFFRKVKFTELDRRVAFAAGLFLLTTTFVNQIITNYLKEIQTYIANFKQKYL